MLVPLSWLRDFAPFDLEPSALGEVFDYLGMVVEEITLVGAGLEDVVVAHVLSIEAIPGADKIRKVMVDAGRPEPAQIVCGAWNFQVGDDVPLAPVGAVLPGDFRIGRRTMKGVASEGMLCSARELGLGDDAAGLLVLQPGHAPGEPIMSALGIESDVVYDLAIEANRPDANCIAGVARDAAARLHLPFAVPSPPPLPSPASAAAASFELRVTAPDLCDRFTATVFDGIVVGPSPAWVASRLTLAGMRPISNVVDASNYVMLELGQPTHAYDLQRLPGPVLGARAAVVGEQLTTLDDVARVLGEGTHPDCVITDANDVTIGIAGIMGGASSEVHDGTTRIVLEAAHFVPMAIARTSKRLGLRSEASARFERGVDIDGIDRAVARFAAILRETCPSMTVSEAPVDWRADVEEPAPIEVRVDRVNAILGVTLTPGEMQALLEPIGFGVAASDSVLRVEAPTFRPDVTREIEVVEEIARHYGYSNVPRTTVRPLQVGRLTDHQRARRRTRALLTGAGVTEAATGPLVGPGDHQRSGLPETGIRASDPLVLEESVLRTSLRPVLLRAAAFNTDRRISDVRLFEIGRVWPSPVRADGPLPVETEVLGVVLVDGEGAPAAVRLLRRLAAGLRVPVELAAATSAGLHPTRTASVVVAGVSIGFVGEIDPTVTEAWGIPGRAAWIEVEVDPLFAARTEGQPARPVSRFPSSDIDLAFAVGLDVPAGAVEQTLAEAAGELLEWIELFDVYRGAGVPEGARSLAYRLRLSSTERTLTDADVAAVRTRCIDAVAAKHGAVLRA